MQQAFDYSVDRRDIGNKATEVRLLATEAEKAAIAERLSLASLTTLSARLSVRRASGMVRIEGRVEAEVEQRSVVSLEPVAETVNEAFVLELVSEEEAARRDDDEHYADPDAPEYDALEGDSVHLGEIAIQTLAMALDPYPRRADEDLADMAAGQVEIDGDPLKPASPFSVLSGLKAKE